MGDGQRESQHRQPSDFLDCIARVRVALAMPQFFRTIRRKLLQRQRIANYSLYALGEIVLVVVGILIALQINNWNDRRKLTAQEHGYLRNLRADLVSNIDKMETFLSERREIMEAAQAVVAALEAPTLGDIEAFNRNCIRVYEWQRFVQVDFTLQELLYSGSLGLIRQEEIKSGLLRLQSAAEANKAEEDHLRFDAEQLLYLPIYTQVDLHPLLRAFEGEKGVLTPDHFAAFHQDPRFKNGFLMAIIEFSILNGQMEQMMLMCQDLIAAIDEVLPGG